MRKLLTDSDLEMLMDCGGLRVGAVGETAKDQGAVLVVLLPAWLKLVIFI